MFVSSSLLQVGLPNDTQFTGMTDYMFKVHATSTETLSKPTSSMKTCTPIRLATLSSIF
jgi:hypothetical protein